MEMFADSGIVCNHCFCFVHLALWYVEPLFLLEDSKENDVIQTLLARVQSKKDATAA